MTTKELIQVVATDCRLPVKDVDKVILTTLAAICDELIADREVNLLGFGKFSVKHRPERSGRHPRTGEDITIPEHKIVYFKLGATLKRLVNND